MATPRDGLRTHQRRLLPAAPLQQLTDVPLEFGREHIVGETLKRTIEPGRVRRVRLGLTPTAEAGQMYVADSVVTKFSGQFIAVEMRAMARTWKSTDVDDQTHFAPTQQLDKLIERPVGMTNRQKQHCRCSGMHDERLC